MSRRTERIGEQIRAELARLLREETSDRRIGLVTLTQVDVSPDLSNARVYWSAMKSEDSDDRATIARRDSRAPPGFCAIVSPRFFDLKRVPELRFRYDSSLAQGESTLSLLREIQRWRAEVAGGAAIGPVPAASLSSTSPWVGPLTKWSTQRVAGSGSAEWGISVLSTRWRQGCFRSRSARPPSWHPSSLRDSRVYVGSIRLGVATDTFDAEGRVLRRFEGPLPSEEGGPGGLGGFSRRDHADPAHVQLRQEGWGAPLSPGSPRRRGGARPAPDTDLLHGDASLPATGDRDRGLLLPGHLRTDPGLGSG